MNYFLKLKLNLSKSLLNLLILFLLNCSNNEIPEDDDDILNNPNISINNDNNIKKTEIKPKTQSYNLDNSQNNIRQSIIKPPSNNSSNKNNDNTFNYHRKTTEYDNTPIQEIIENEKNFYKKYSNTICKCICGKTLKSQKISEAFPDFDDKNYVKTGIINDTKKSRLNGKATYIKCDKCNAIITNGKNNSLLIWNCKSKEHDGNSYNMCLYCTNKLNKPKDKQCDSCFGHTIFPIINGKCSLCIPYLNSMYLTDKIQNQFIKESPKFKKYDLKKLENLYKIKKEKFNNADKRREDFEKNLNEIMMILLKILNKKEQADADHKLFDDQVDFIKIKDKDTFLKDIENKAIITEKFEDLTLKSLSSFFNNLNLDNNYKQYLNDLLEFIKFSKKSFSFKFNNYSYRGHQFYQGQTPPQVGNKYSGFYFTIDTDIYGIIKKTIGHIGL
ncbi:MAG: hypothetical protein GY830_04790 [Bacteroidetes bacterium]|nr:hypothetical protein [Bacteroidota bacterium]